MDEDDGRGHCNLTRPSAHLPPMPGPFSHGAGAAHLVHGMRVRSAGGMDGRDYRRVPVWVWANEGAALSDPVYPYSCFQRTRTDHAQRVAVCWT